MILLHFIIKEKRNNRFFKILQYFVYPEAHFFHITHQLLNFPFYDKKDNKSQLNIFCVKKPLQQNMSMHKTMQLLVKTLIQIVKFKGTYSFILQLFFLRINSNDLAITSSNFYIPYIRSIANKLLLQISSTSRFWF